MSDARTPSTTPSTHSLGTTEELRIPIVQEEAHVFKRAATTDRVTVRTGAEEHQVVLRDELVRGQVTMHRVSIEREVAEMPPVRTEGEVTIVPVVEERLVVEKRLFLVEELHLTRETTLEQVEVPATLRRTRVDIERSLPQQEEI
jgi:stress response protein YsnF